MTFDPLTDVLHALRTTAAGNNQTSPLANDTVQLALCDLDQITRTAAANRTFRDLAGS